MTISNLDLSKLLYDSSRIHILFGWIQSWKKEAETNHVVFNSLSEKYYNFRWQFESFHRMFSPSSVHTYPRSSESYLVFFTPRYRPLASRRLNFRKRGAATDWYHPPASMKSSRRRVGRLIYVLYACVYQRGREYFPREGHSSPSTWFFRNTMEKVRLIFGPVPRSWIYWVCMCVVRVKGEREWGAVWIFLMEFESLKLEVFKGIEEICSPRV